MSDWYYSTDRQQPIGPVSADALRQLLDSGQLPAGALLWREGLERWHRPDELATELGPAIPATPRPLPSLLPPALGPASPAAPRMPRPAPAPRRTGLILGLVGLGLLVLLVPVLGILAAIALPAYNSYTERANTAAVLIAAAPLQERVSQHLHSQGQCPTPESPGFGAPESYADPAAHIATITVVTAVNGNCGLAIALDKLHRDKHARQAWLWLEHQRQDGQWVCRSSLRDQQLPAHCRQ